MKNNPLLSRVDISSDNIMLSETPVRKLAKYEHAYMVQCATDKEIFKQFQKEYPDVRIGFTTFCKLKSFYVRPCEPADIETCCCRTH